MTDDPPQPGRVQPPGRLHQHRLGLGREVIRQVLGVVGQHLGMGRRDGPLDQGLAGGGQGTAEQGPGGPDQAGGRTGTHAQPGSEPGGGGADLDALLGPGGPPGIHRGQPGQAVAVHPVRQPPQPQHPLGQGDVAQPVQVLGGQPVDLGLQRRQPIQPGDRMCVRVHGRNLSTPDQNTSTTTTSGDNFSHRAGSPPRAHRVQANPRARQLHGARGSRPTAPAPRTGPDPPGLPTHRASSPHPNRPPRHPTHPATQPPDARRPRPDPTPAIRFPSDPVTRPVRYRSRRRR